MLEPVGPLPPSVYWRRRAVAVAVVVLVLAFLIWAIAAASSADGGSDVSAAAPPPASAGPASPVASRGALPTAAPPGPNVAALESALRAPGAGGLLGSPGLPGSTPQTGATPGDGALPGADSQPGGASGTQAGAGTTPPGQSPAAQIAAPQAPATQAPATQPPAGSPVPPAPGSTPPAAPTPAAAPAPAPPEAAPPACADGDLRITARTDKPRYGAGEHPLFSLVVTNTGTAPCTRDLDAARQAMAVVRKPGDGLWGSNDCSPAHTNDVRILAPNQEAVFSVRWAGRTSAPGCTGVRDVAPGTYELLTRLDGTISDPARFTLDP